MGIYTSSVGPSRQIFRNKNVDLKALADKIVSYFYARDFQEVDLAEDRKGGWYEIQGAKKFGYLKLKRLGPRSAVHVIIRGEPNDFEIMVGSGGRGVFTAISGALDSLTFGGFEEDFWEYVKRQIPLTQLREVSVAERPMPPPMPSPMAIERPPMEEVTVPMVGPMLGNLQCMAGPQTGQNFPLYKSVVALGRARDCEVLLTDYTVSRRHAQITYDGVNFYVEDLGSKNGTFVSGQMLPPRQRQMLANGSEIRLGTNTTLKFITTMAAEETRPA